MSNPFVAFSEANSCSLQSSPCTAGKYGSDALNDETSSCVNCVAGKSNPAESSGISSCSISLYDCSCSNGSPLRGSSGCSGCSSCNGGYYLSGKTCAAYGGSCSNGALITQSSRTQHNHCGSCNGGYYLSGKTCAAYGGSCSNGALITQSSRTQHNHCGSCNGG